jgi:hypothetical protein
MPHAISFLSLVQGIMGEIYFKKKKKKHLLPDTYWVSEYHGIFLLKTLLQFLGLR